MNDRYSAFMEYSLQVAMPSTSAISISPSDIITERGSRKHLQPQALAMELDVLYSLATYNWKHHGCGKMRLKILNHWWPVGLTVRFFVLFYNFNYNYYKKNKIIIRWQNPCKLPHRTLLIRTFFYAFSF